ncbi:SHOCT domain-containing protein [Pseudonocardia broussonetiae]|uniref:SHOCT domain-containing protein n=1 Tax=Pseudonocardia broussonetiae TaxID=2736640 RepID=A0A6M6JPU0_9PSEU|nr:SHOCT domain-containing protein [Pseudonocardia broussonetiae]QJY48987.1 SHOCT domain-containing protein [Pseudonocardia broussonetiae]
MVMPWMAGGMVFWWFAAAVVVVLLVVGASVAVAGRGDDEAGSAHDVLAERFARGEIDEEEYRRRTAVLRGDPG